MDLGLFFRVLLRFKTLVLGGIVLAIVLSTLSFARVGWAKGQPTFHYRKQETWQGYTTLELTPPGFPLGSAPLAGEASTEYSNLALVYATLATSDAVKKLVRTNGGPYKGQIGAVPVSAGPNGPGLPFVTVSGTGTSRRAASALAARAAKAFIQYVHDRDEANGIPAKRQIALTVLNGTVKPVLLKGRSKTLPIVIFLTVITAACGLAFVLENLRPRVQAVTANQGAVLARRTA